MATIGSIVAGIIVVGILLVVLKAHQSNDIVNALTDAARWLAGPFDGMFSLDSARWTVALNWGIAAAVYLMVARLVARLLIR